MPTWGGILAELNAAAQQGKPPNPDAVRRKYLIKAHQKTGRSVILYATNFTQPGVNLPPDFITINDEDLQGFMEVMHGLEGPDLDLVLHSPGGSIAAAEALVNYLRSKFDSIRVIVPQQAMSAATLVACASDVVVMGKHSSLGPIDPQITLQTPLGLRMVPAEAVIEQFKRAKIECEDPRALAAWAPMLSQYGPDLLIRCQNAMDLSHTLAKRWLEQFNLAGRDEAAQTAERLAAWLASHNSTLLHERHISRQELEAAGLNVEHLEGDQEAQDLFLSIYHAVTHTFQMTPAVKIIENHMGQAFIKTVARPAPPPNAGPKPPNQQ